MKTQTALSEYKGAMLCGPAQVEQLVGGVLLSQDSEAGLLEQLPSEWSPGYGRKCQETVREGCARLEGLACS